MDLIAFLTKTFTLQTINMEQKQITATYAEAVKAIKEAILESRYRAARLVNKEVLALYYAIWVYFRPKQSSKMG